MILGKKKKKAMIKKLEVFGIKIPSKVKSSCCEKYKKSEDKRCGKCPCFDLLKKVA